MKRELKRADFEVRECKKYENVYRIEQNGTLTKNGKPDANLHVEAHVNGQNIYRLWDGSAFVGELQKDFGWKSNSYPFERIGTYQEILPNGNIRKYSRDVYRTKEKGMYCVDNWGDWLSDGVRHAPEPRTGKKQHHLQNHKRW